MTSVVTPRRAGTTGEEAVTAGTLLRGQHPHLGGHPSLLLLRHRGLHGLKGFFTKLNCIKEILNLLHSPDSERLPDAELPGGQGGGHPQHQEVDGDEASQRSPAEGLHDLLQERSQNSG